MVKPKLNTFIIPVLTTDNIERCLETLYRYTETGTFYVYVVDQTVAGLDATDLRDRYPNLLVLRTPKSDMHRTGNLGHSQATNLGLRFTDTPYATMLNDDVEFINSGWWQGVLDTFERVLESTPDRPAIMVNVASVKLPDWSIGRAAGDDFYILPYKETYTQAEYDSLVNDPHYVNEHLTIQPGSVIDGINLYCTVTDMRKLLEVGYLDEYWYPGNANDYDYSCRAYMFGYRCVSTTLSWVFHHWSKTFHAEKERDALVQPELNHGDLRDKWGDRLDIWGVRCKDCQECLRTTDGRTARCPNGHETYQIPQNTTAEL